MTRTEKLEMTDVTLDVGQGNYFTGTVTYTVENKDGSLTLTDAQLKEGTLYLYTGTETDHSTIANNKLFLKDGNIVSQGKYDKGRLIEGRRYSESGTYFEEGKCNPTTGEFTEIEKKGIVVDAGTLQFLAVGNIKNIGSPLTGKEITIYVGTEEKDSCKLLTANFDYEGTAHGTYHDHDKTKLHAERKGASFKYTQNGISFNPDTKARIEAIQRAQSSPETAAQHGATNAFDKSNPFAGAHVSG